MYICAYVHMYVYVYFQIYVCICIYICVYMDTQQLPSRDDRRKSTGSDHQLWRFSYAVETVETSKAFKSFWIPFAPQNSQGFLQKWGSRPPKNDDPPSKFWGTGTNQPPARRHGWSSLPSCAISTDHHRSRGALCFDLLMEPWDFEGDSKLSHNGETLNMTNDQSLGSSLGGSPIFSEIPHFF